MMTLFATELVVWRRKLAQMCDIVDPGCVKEARWVSQNQKNQSGNNKDTKLRGCELPTRDPGRNTGASDYVKQQKHNRTLQPRDRLLEKTRHVSTKMSEKKPLTTTKAGIALVILPTCVRSHFGKNEDFLHENMNVSTMCKITHS